MPRTHLSLAEARRIALRAQALDRPREMSVSRLLEHLGAVQLDTISVLARSHELVPYARLGAIGRDRVETALWGHGKTFEYWSHAACVLPATAFPLWAFRRRESVPKRERWGASPRAVAHVRAALAERGPQTATELGGARKEAGWWNWSDEKNAVEWMLATGEVVVTDRRAWRRVYDLTERAITVSPEAGWVHDRDVYGPADSECARSLLLASIRTLGVGTWDDIRDVHRLPSKGMIVDGRPTFVLRDLLDELIDSNAITEVAVEGWSQPSFADTNALRRIPSETTSLTTLLSPFDSLIWYRARLQRLFDVHMRIEAYTPKADRKHGYFAMPVLHGGRILGFVDPAREGDAFVARNISVLERDDDGFAQAIAAAARWVGKSRVVVEAGPYRASIARAANALLSS